MSFLIRPAFDSDIPGIVEVIRTVFDEYFFTWEPEGYHLDLYNLEKHYDGISDRFFVGEVDGRIIGTIALGMFNPIPGQDGTVGIVNEFLRVGGCDCALERLYVHPTARRLGVGRGLVEHILGIARSEGKRAMEVWSDKRFVDAHRLYERVGGRVVGERICHDPDQSPEWGLVIALPAI